MIDLIKFFQILFLSPKISRERLKLFAETHIQYLTANNPGGIFDSILAAITGAYKAYFGDLVDIATITASVKSLTEVRNGAQLALLLKIRELEPLIQFTFRATPAIYTQFYPNGLTEYDKATQSEFETIALRYKKTLELNAIPLPPDELLAFNNLWDTYSNGIINELKAQGKAAGERSEIGSTKLALCTVLTQNVLTIALQYSGDTSKASVYFDQSILRAAFSDNSTAEGDLNVAETANAFSNTKKPDTQYRIKLITEGKVRLGFMPGEEDTVPAGYGTEIESGTDWQQFTASALGYSSENKFLNITNTGEVTTSFIIERV